MNPWLKALAEIGRSIRAKQRQEQRPPRTPYHERHEKIVNSDIKWVPVDKTAALVISQAPWWAHFQEKSSTPERSDSNQTRKTKNEAEAKSALRLHKQKNNMTPKELKEAGPKVFNKAPDDSSPDSRRCIVGGEEYFNIYELAVKVVDQISKMVPSDKTQIARASYEARKVLDESMHHIGAVMDDFKQKTSDALTEIRQVRFNFVSETAQMVKPLNEIRQFFLGEKDYAKEVERLKEFVELCERLEALKQRGTLDAIGDTIIKLSVG